MPGVEISTSVRTSPSSATVRPSSQLFVVGLAERGPSDTATLVESLAEFEDVFGGYRSNSYLHPTVQSFFEEGGTRCFVARSVGSAATIGTKVLNSASAAACITLVANGAGDWSADIEVAVSVASGTFKIDLFYDDVFVYSTGTVTTSSQAVGRINTSPVASRYVSAAVNNENTTPVVLAKTAFSAGSSDDSALDEDDFTASLESFNDALGVGSIACAENFTASMHSALVVHANEYNRIALLCATENATVAQVKAVAEAVRSDLNAEHAAVYFPWVTVPTSTQGINRVIPPLGYVAAKRALAHNTTGAHVPAAGLISASRFLVGTLSDVNKSVGDELDEAAVNAIRVIQNTVRIYGARSCSVDEQNFRYITQQDVVNSIVSECYTSIEDLVFSPIDGRNSIFSSIEARLISILASMKLSGALFPAFDVNGKQLDDGYTVTCDRTLNPASQLNEGLVKAKIGVRVSSIGDRIEIDIVKSNLVSSVS